MEKLEIRNGNIIDMNDSVLNRNSVIGAMRDNMEYSQDEHSQIGIFWYDKYTDDLFGINKVDSEDVDFVHTSEGDIKYYKKLHKDIWRKESYRGKDKRFVGDYTSIPRGRVSFYKDMGYVVFIGDWIDDYPSVRNDIIEVFELPNDVIFIKDKHWNIGHEWSEEVFD